VPESYLFWPFFFGFFAYHFWIRNAWARLESGPSAAVFDADEEAQLAK
jgi:hypothetical protein